MREINQSFIPLSIQPTARQARRVLTVSIGLLHVLIAAASVLIATPSFAAKVSAKQTYVVPGMEGERTCFWYRGPHSADPYINVAYPDANVYYWAATFTMPKGSKLSIEGDFAHARYQSLISYDELGRPIEALADYLIKPIEGSSNPFRTGTDRQVRARHYRVEVLNQAQAPGTTEGEYVADSERNVVHAPEGPNQQQILLYRIYLPDGDRSITGGVSLPEPVLTLADGQTLQGQPACDAMDTTQTLKLAVNALGIPVEKYRALINQPGKPDTWPATNPSTWHIQLDRKSLLGIYTGNISENARRSEGGFFPNPDNNYIRTIVNRKHGPVYVVTGKMPTTPHTVDHRGSVEQGQLRYWSICSNQGFANTRVNDCLYDEEVPLNAQGYYTVVVSRPEDRPRNARPECGLAWLPMAADGDGVFDADVSVVQIRNMLADPGFEQAIQRIGVDRDIEPVMGEFFPTSFYTLPNIVETAFACPLTIH